MPGRPMDAYDVIISYNSEDWDEVRDLVAELERRGLRPYWDKERVAPGALWTPEIEGAIERNRVVAVVIGPGGLGPVHDEERQLAIRLQRTVIPVLLAGARPDDVKGFLGNRSLVDLSKGGELDRLVSHIEGLRGVDTQTSRSGSDGVVSRYLDKLTQRTRQLGVGDYILAERASAYRWPMLYQRPERYTHDPFSEGDVLGRKAFGDARKLLANPGERVVLVAGAGLGKTALLEALALEVGRRGELPVILSLPAFGRVAEETALLDYAADFSRQELGVRLPVEQCADEGSLVLLLDGLDEVPSSQRGWVVRRIRDATSDAPRMSWVITARDPSLTIDIDAVELWLLPLEDEVALQDFLTGYLSDDRAREVVGVLRDRPALLSICRIPLFATLLAGRVEHQGIDRIPAGPHELLTELIDFWLEPSRFSADRALLHPPDLLRRSARALAHRMLDHDLSVVDAHRAREWLEANEADLVLDDLVRAGILARGGGTIRFSLPTVHELLAGERLATLESSELLERVATQISRPWGQALQLALVVRADGGSLVESILRQEDDVFGTRLRMCARVVSWGASTSSDVRREIGERLGTLALELPFVMSIRDEVLHTLTTSFSDPLPESLVEELARRRFGFEWDDLLCCADDETVSRVLANTLAPGHDVHVWRDVVVERLRRLGRAAIDMVVGWAMSDRPGLVTPHTRFEMGVLLTRIAREPELRSHLRARWETGGFPTEMERALVRELAEPAVVEAQLERDLGRDDAPGSYDAEHRLWDHPNRVELWHRVVLDPGTDRRARRRLMVQAAHRGDGWSTRLASIARDPCRAQLLRAEAWAALASRGDAGAFASLTDMVPDGDLDIVELWCFCLGCHEGPDTERGADSILQRGLSDVDRRRLLRILRFPLTTHVDDTDLGDFASGTPRESPHPVAARLVALGSGLGSSDPFELCLVSTILLELGDRSRVDELSELVRRLWSGFDPDASDEESYEREQILGGAVSALPREALGRPLLEDMVRRAPWNLAQDALSTLSLPVDDLDTAFRLHREREFEDHLLLPHVHRAALERGHAVTEEDLHGDPD